MLSFNYAITKEDYINYYTYVAWDAPDKRKKHFMYYGQQLLTNGVIVVILCYSGLFYNRPSLMYIYVSILLAIVVLQFFSGRSKIKKQAEKIADDPYNQSIFSPTAYQFAETGVLCKDEVKETRLSWNAFIKKMENEEYYFLFLNKIEAVIVPKRVFKTTAEQATFDHLLTTCLSFDAEIAHLIR